MRTLHRTMQNSVAALNSPGAIFNREDLVELLCPATDKDRIALLKKSKGELEDAVTAKQREENGGQAYTFRDVASRLIACKADNALDEKVLSKLQRLYTSVRMKTGHGAYAVSGLVIFILHLSGHLVSRVTSVN